LADPYYDFKNVAANILASREICEENGVVFLLSAVEMTGLEHLNAVMFNPAHGLNINGRDPDSDDRDGSDQDLVDSAIRMSSENCLSAGRKGVIRAGEEEEKKETLTTAPVKKSKSKMHCCEICFKKFPRPSGLRTHMNTHSASHVKPYPCGFPGCTRSFVVRSNARRHLRTHSLTPATNHNSTDSRYTEDFCPPMIGGAPQSSDATSSHHPSQLEQEQLHFLTFEETGPSLLLYDICPHGVLPTPATNPNSTDSRYTEDFCLP